MVREADCTHHEPVPLRAGVCGALAFLPSLLAEVDGMVLTTCCDQMRRAAEWLSDDTRVFLFNFPSTRSQERLLEAEKTRLLKWVAQLPQVSDRSKRRGESAIDATTEGHKDTRLKREDEKETLSIGVLGGHFCGDRQRVEAFFEKRGIHLPLWGCENGERVGDLFQRPNACFYDQVQSVIHSRHIDGLIVARTTWCDVWRLACVRLHEVVSVPVMEWVMDSQCQGQPFPDGASTTRLEAFCELLRARRQEGG